MKKYTFLVFLTVLTVFTHTVISQGTFHYVGTDVIQNTNSSFPSIYGNWYRGVKNQMLIKASEMQAAGMSAGNITGLAFDVSASTGSTMQSFEMQINSTAQNSLTSWISNLNTCYGPINYSDLNGWNQHDFHSPFYWDGVSNIVIQTCFYNPGWSQNAKMKMSNYSYNTLIYRRRDGSSPCNNNWINGVETLRPNIRFKWLNPNSPPITDFNSNTNSTCSGTISFFDQTSNTPTSWSWDFGDGNTSTLQNPIHTYTTSGTFSVELTTTNPYGSSTKLYPNLIQVNLSSLNPIPPSCIPNTQVTTAGFGISEVKFGNLHKFSGNASEGYSDFTCDSTLLYIGKSYDFLAVHSAPSSNSHNCKAWIDYNNDGIFDINNEEVASSTSADSTIASIQIPNNAITGTPIRMRVIADFSLLGAISSPCADPQYGQAEDYTLYFEQDTQPPIVDFSSNKTYTCDGVIQFNDLSSNGPYAWYWVFGDGATAISQNPVHTYSTNGIYDVTLIATNLFGTDTLIKTQLIEVNTANAVTPASCYPSTLGYCCDYGISRVQFSNINNPSLNGIEGYVDYSCDQRATVEVGTNYALRIYTGPNNPQDTRAWIDFDTNGVFSSTEKVMEKLNDYDPVAIIQIPTSVPTNVPIRLRISSDEVGSNNGPCDDVNRGQVEDYALIVATCPNPNSVSIGQISKTSIELSWTAGGNENSWNIIYGPAGFGILSGTGIPLNNIFTNNFTITGLNELTSYDFYLQANCPGNTSNWTGPYNATTLNITNGFPSDFKLYPNPNNGEFYISSNASINNVEVYDLLGKNIYSSNVVKTNNLKLDLNNEPNGIYFVKVSDVLNNLKTFKIILKK
jgi:PKD repeat protein